MTNYIAIDRNTKESMHITEDTFYKIKGVKYGKIEINGCEFERSEINLKVIVKENKTMQIKSYSDPEYTRDLNEFESFKVNCLTKSLHKPRTSLFNHDCKKIDDILNFLLTKYKSFNEFYNAFKGMELERKVKFIEGIYKDYQSCKTDYINNLPF